LPSRLRKIRRMRGSRTHGYGRVSQHRKSGSRGGKGNAGGKNTFRIRTIVYEPDRFRNIGFVRRGHEAKPERATINVGELENLAMKKFGIKATSKKKKLELDLTEMGYGKLLSRGEISIPIVVTVSSFSSKAGAKVEAAGGEIKSE